MSRMSMVLMLVGTLVAAAIGAAIPMLWLGGSQTAPVVSGANGAVATPRIDVTASGKVYAAPDQATVQIGVNTQSKSVSEALKQNSQDTTAVIEQIKGLGVDAKDIQTSNFSISPTYDESYTRVNGYQVSNTVVVTIRDLSQTGALLDGVVEAGANSILGLSFDIADPTELQAEARAQAIANAKQKAEQMAEAAGVSLGEVLSINESISYVQPAYAMDRGMVAAEAMPVPVETGQQQISVDVSISYRIK